MADTGIERVHKSYGIRRPQWERCRAVIEGSDAVKAATTKYLPRLSGQTRFSDAGAGLVDEYGAYLQRATFFGATGRTVQGLLGLLFRKALSITPDVEQGVMADLVKRATAQGETLEVFAHRLACEVLSVGRVGVLVEFDEATRTPYFCSFAAENICNWRVEMAQGAQAMLTQVVLSECSEEPAPDGFGVREVEQYRVLELIDGAYVEIIWRKTGKGNEQWAPVEEKIPRRRGEPLNFIPFRFVNASHQLPECEKPPLLDLVDLNLAHYRNAADYEHGVHYTALPTAWVVGFPADSELRIGSGTAWVSDNPAAKAGFLEFTGQGLGALENALAAKERQMAVIGARMLEGQKREAETAEALRIRQAGDAATLSTIAQSVSEGLTTAMQWALWWSGVGMTVDDLDGAVTVELNQDFAESTLSGEELIRYMTLVQEGFMSEDTYHWLQQQGELMPPGRTIEEERALIATDQAKRDRIEPRDRGVPPIPAPQEEEEAA